MPLPHDLCSKLVNASRARHRYVPLPPTHQHLSILSVLLSQGFITSVSLGSSSTTPFSRPRPEEFKEARLPEKRVWAELKYRGDRPVLGSAELVSMPAKRAVMDKHELLRFVGGKRVHFVNGLQMGEVAIVKTAKGILEGREALHRGLGGEILARVGG